MYIRTEEKYGNSEKNVTGLVSRLVGWLLDRSLMMPFSQMRSFKGLIFGNAIKH
jgi:hypothetical protein